MPFWDDIFQSLLGSATDFDTDAIGTVINPATSLPMVGGGFGGVDVGGSPYGTDIHSMQSDSIHHVGSPWSNSNF